MKISEKTADCALVVKVKTSGSEVVDVRELDRFSRMFFRCFLKPQLLKENLIEYTGPEGITLEQRMRKEITQRDFLFILEHIVVAVEKLKANNFPLYNLRMELDQIYINEKTKELQFLYAPIMGPTENSNIVDLLKAVCASARSSSESDRACVTRFLYFFRNLKMLDLGQVEAFVQREDPTVVNTVKKNNAGQSGFMTSKRQHYYEHMEQQKEAAPQPAPQPAVQQADDPTGLLTEEDPTGLLTEEDPTGLLMEEVPATVNAQPPENTTAYVYPAGVVYATEATVNLDEEEKTGLLVSQAPTDLMEDDGSGETELLAETVTAGKKVIYPELFRVSTGETVKVNKPVFRVGKERSYVDYFVTNNNAVSRSHLDVITRDSGFYVMDLNSKNRTYINNIPIPPQQEVSISNGDALRLGNEEFVFRTGTAEGRIPLCPHCKAQAKPGAVFCAFCGTKL